MSLIAQTIRTLLAAALLCVFTSHVTAQTETRAGGSTVRGTAVYADTGRPLRHAAVILIPDAGESELDTVSDRRGQFVFQNVPAGRYVLFLEAPGILRPDNYDRRGGPMIPQLRLFEKSELFTEVNVNGTDSVEVKVQAVRGGVITGRVVTEDDQPLVNADVKLLRRENGKWIPVWQTWTNGPDDKVNRKTDASGNYRIAGLPAGEYLVRVSEPALGSDFIAGEEDSYRDGAFMVAYHPAATRIKDAQAVSAIEGSESTAFDIRLPERAPHVLTGSVTVAPENAPGSWVSIVIERTDEVGFSSLTRQVTTRSNAEGKWHVNGLPAGEYAVTMGGSVKIGTDTISGYIHAANKRTVVRIRDEKVTVLNVTLTRGAQIRGRVTLNGKAPPGEWLISAGVSRTGDPAKDDVNDLLDRTGFLRDAGRFEVTGLPGGTYWFTLQGTVSHEYYVKSVIRKGVDLMQTPIKLADESVFDEVVVTLATDMASVEARVTLPEGAPKGLPGDVIVVVAPANDLTRRFSSGAMVLQPDAKGKISFTCAPGEYFVVALTPDQMNGPLLTDEYFEKNTDRLLRIKLRAGQKMKDVTVRTVM